MKISYSHAAAAFALLISGAVVAQVSTKPANAADVQKALTAHGPTFGSHTGVERAGGPPPNDGCGSVTFQALAVGGSITFTGDLTGATPTGDYEPGSLIDSVANADGLYSVWHGFTLGDCADVTISYCNINPPFSNVWIVISDVCPIGGPSMIFNTSFNTTECTDGNVTVHFNGLQPGDYYVPIMQDVASGVDGPYSVAVSAAACPSASANDECDDAIVLTPYTFCNPTMGTLGATESLPAITCNGFLGDANDDVWFSFVATATDMTIAVDGDGSDLNVSYDAVVELLEGTCAGPVSLACADATLGGELEVIEATGLTVGNTYYVRVYHWYAANPDTPTFWICVVEGVGINIGMEENTASDFTVFPNPGNGDFTIQCGDNAGLTTIEMMDVRGRMVYSEVVNLASGQQHEVRLAGQLAPGSYTLRLSSSTATSEQAVMVR
jgi:hypothetical protein